MNEYVCSQCGAPHDEDFIRCPACQGFVVDDSPWRSGAGLLAIPIALVLWLIWIGLAHLAAAQDVVTTGIDAISLVIIGLAIYGLVVVAFKWRVTARQARAFLVIQRCCARTDTVDAETIAAARQALLTDGTATFNGFVAFHRLRLLRQVSSSEQTTTSDGVLEAMRQHADADWEALDNSFASTQFLIWLLPTAGFLGTVYGMTHALQSFSSVIGTTTSEFGLASSLTDTTRNLGIAFHTTLVGLAAVIPLLALTTALRRRSQSLLEQIDKFFLRLATYSLYTHKPAPPPAIDEPLPTGPPVLPAQAAVVDGPLGRDFLDARLKQINSAPLNDLQDLIHTFFRCPRCDGQTSAVTVVEDNFNGIVNDPRTLTDTFVNDPDKILPELGAKVCDCDPLTRPVLHLERLVFCRSNPMLNNDAHIAVVYSDKTIVEMWILGKDGDYDLVSDERRVALLGV
ncbi:MAG: MotA/TolQ/ExbB proton channel family protein [Lentisphaeria bacterium]|jgi:biopolymer transport protein ExbB/TolQ|nr:MotA/TolQ/ExbB proton channel family protein [Lentisphaeria bacterium]